MMKKKYYILTGNTIQEWVNSTPMGPFSSKEECRKAIKEDAEGVVNEAVELEAGVDEDWFEQYHIVEHVEVIKPILEVKTKVKFKN